MLDYQIMVILFFVCLILSTLVIGLIDSAIMKHKAKKEAFAELERKNKQLKDVIYRLKFNTELRGLNIDD